MINKFKLNELGSVNRGKSKHRPRNDPTLYGGVYPFVQTGDVKHSPFYLTEHSQSYNEKGLSQSRLWPAGTLCITIAANIADTAILTYPACFPDSIIGFLPDKKKTDVKYVKYCLDTFQLQMKSISQGTTQDNMSVEKLLSIDFPAPELKEQKKIAAILSAYDDLIENNKRRITLLEKMAEEIYREWFVRFRFPDYQSAEFEKGIPKGWEAVELKDIAIENSKATKAGNHLENRFYLPLDIMGSKQFLPLNHYDFTEAKSSLVTFEKGEFIFGAMRPYQHKIVIAPFDGITRTTCFVLKPKEDYFYSYLYLTLFKESTIDYAMLISNGTDRPYTVWNRGMERMGVLNPDQDTLKSFEEKVRPIIDLILEYYFIQQNLSKTRDALLPRLISGKLSVEDLDIQFPPSMMDEAEELVSG